MRKNLAFLWGRRASAMERYGYVCFAVLFTMLPVAELVRFFFENEARHGSREDLRQALRRAAVTGRHGAAGLRGDFPKDPWRRNLRGSCTSTRYSRGWRRPTSLWRPCRRASRNNRRSVDLPDNYLRDRYALQGCRRLRPSASGFNGHASSRAPLPSRLRGRFAPSHV